MSRSTIAVASLALILVSAFGGLALADRPGVRSPAANEGRQPQRRGEHSPAVTITEFRHLVRAGKVACLSVGPKADAFWVTDYLITDVYGSSLIFRVDANGHVTRRYFLPDNDISGYDVVSGPDGNLWFTTGQTYITLLKMTPDGAFTGFQFANDRQAWKITVGPDRALWVTVAYGPTIVRVTTGGQISYFQTGITQNANLGDIAVGSDGALWFTEKNTDKIGRITTQGSVTEFSSGISSGAGPTSIAPGPDGALWFTEAAGRIGRITTTGSVSEYANGISPNETPLDLAAGPDGAIWFTESIVQKRPRGAKIGRITTSGAITEYTAGLSDDARPMCIVAGPDGNMWFNETRHDGVARVNLTS